MSQKRLELGHVSVQPGDLTHKQKHDITHMHTHTETALCKMWHGKGVGGAGPGLPVPPESSLLWCDWFVPPGALLWPPLTSAPITISTHNTHTN